MRVFIVCVCVFVCNSKSQSARLLVVALHMKHFSEACFHFGEPNILQKKKK